VFGGIYSALYAIAKIISYSLVFMLGIYFWGPKLSLFERFILKDEINADQGFVALEKGIFDHLTGLEGVAVSPCRPGGKVKIGDERFDVISDGEYIEKGARVSVRKVEGSRIVVRQLSE
jgi:membrane-bound serine protease (ClpP class)